MQEYLSIANSSWMWFAAFVPMCVLGTQVILLLRKSLQDGKKMGIRSDQIKRAIVGSATASIGPSLAIFAGLISLILMMGAPIAWLRLSYIGAVMYELTSADVGAQAVGVAFTPETMNVTAFANGVWAMILGSIGWIIVSGLFTDKIDKLRSVMSGGDSASLPIITAGATLGCYCYLTFSRFYPVVASNRQIYAVLGGALTMLVLTFINKNRKAKWVSEWGATIAMIIGMACAAVMK